MNSAETGYEEVMTSVTVETPSVREMVGAFVTVTVTVLASQVAPTASVVTEPLASVIVT